MNQFTFDDSWAQIRGKLRQRYGQLTDDDLEFVEGKGEELLARLRVKLGMSEPDLHAMLNELKASGEGDAGMRAKLSQARARVGEVAEDLRTRVTDAAGSVRAAAGDRAEDLRAHAGEAYVQARERARTMQQDATEYIREKPREALFTALAAGFVAGLLLRK